MDLINNFFANLSNFLWGNFGVANLVIGGGIFFLFYSKLTPFRYFKHAFDILLGKYDDPDDEGQISHFQALSTALSSTVGIGNIAGVAVAISLGGPGALFWMWVSAIVGMATKFFTCSLSIMFRGYDSDGELQGGPMYVIEQGMGKKFKFLSYWFSIAGLVGCLSLLQVNQLTQILSSNNRNYYCFSSISSYFWRIKAYCRCSIQSCSIYGAYLPFCWIIYSIFKPFISAIHF